MLGTQTNLINGELIYFDVKSVLVNILDLSFCSILIYTFNLKHGFSQKTNVA